MLRFTSNYAGTFMINGNRLVQFLDLTEQSKQGPCDAPKNHDFWDKQDWLFDWLMFYGTSTQDRSTCAFLPGGEPALGFKMGACNKKKEIITPIIRTRRIAWHQVSTYSCNQNQVSFYII